MDRAVAAAHMRGVRPINLFGAPPIMALLVLLASASTVAVTLAAVVLILVSGFAMLGGRDSGRARRAERLLRLLLETAVKLWRRGPRRR